MLRFLSSLATFLIGAGIVAAYFEVTSSILGAGITIVGILLLSFLFFLSFLSLVKNGTKGMSWLTFSLGLPCLGVIGAVGYFHFQHPLNDITTDVRNPPRYLFPVFPFKVKYGAEYLDKSLQLNREYNPLETPTQLLSYPGLEGLAVKIPAKDTFEESMRQIKEQLPDWRIVIEDPKLFHSEMMVVWSPFKFTDDVVLEVRPDPTSAQNSRIELRSRSRFGKGDFGVNFARLHHLKARLLLAMKPMEEKFQAAHAEAEKKAANISTNATQTETKP